MLILRNVAIRLIYIYILSSLLILLLLNITAHIWGGGGQNKGLTSCLLLFLFRAFKSKKQLKFLLDGFQ